MAPYPEEIIDNCGNGELVVYYLDYCETRARQYILCNLPMDKASLQNNWHLYLKSMWRILRTFENNLQMYKDEYLLNNEGPLLNVYALLPLNGFTQKHILITSNVLKEICVAANLPDVCQMDVHALWSHYSTSNFMVQALHRHDQRHDISACSGEAALRIFTRQVRESCYELHRYKILVILTTYTELPFMAFHLNSLHYSAPDGAFYFSQAVYINMNNSPFIYC
ncbi:hypothetical protein MIR68_007782 [Amoeboaphelidium protococcarum]|nr:hypothetical protein MIR68_007782 [Amoeboaphelidium protococcarum]